METLCSSPESSSWKSLSSTSSLPTTSTPPTPAPPPPSSPFLPICKNRSSSHLQPTRLKCIWLITTLPCGHFSKFFNDPTNIIHAESCTARLGGLCSSPGYRFEFLKLEGPECERCRFERSCEGLVVAPRMEIQREWDEEAVRERKEMFGEGLKNAVREYGDIGGGDVGMWNTEKSGGLGCEFESSAAGNASFQAIGDEEKTRELEAEFTDPAVKNITKSDVTTRGTRVIKATEFPIRESRSMNDLRYRNHSPHNPRRGYQKPRTRMTTENQRSFSTRRPIAWKGRGVSIVIEEGWEYLGDDKHGDKYARGNFRCCVVSRGKKNWEELWGKVKKFQMSGVL